MNKYLLLTIIFVIAGVGFFAWRVTTGKNSTEGQFQELPTQESDTAASPGQSKTSTASNGSQIVNVSNSGAYTISTPVGWRIERGTSKMGEITHKDIYVYDTNGALIMKIRSSLAEIGYESLETVEQSNVQSAIGSLGKFINVNPDGRTDGFARYTWHGGSNFFENSFEIFVPFGTSPYYKTTEDYQSGKTTPLHFGSLSAFKQEQAAIEKIIANISAR